MAVLYRKYRPQTFSEVVGQKHIIRTLKNQVTSGQVSHAYLFTGSRGIGKTSVARILAKAVNCVEREKRIENREEDKAGDPCGQCEVCKAVEQGNFLDLVEIDAASNTGVDNIRDLIEHVKFSPSKGKYKVFIIDEVHMLSKGAFNALLKTLEEPPAHAIFVLATTEANKVPSTIISRTQRFDFKRFSVAEITELLESVISREKIEVNKDVIKLIAESSEGGGRDALSLLDKVVTLGPGATLEECAQLLGITDFKTCHGLLNLILQGQMAELPKFFDSLLEKGTDFAVFNRDFLEYLRKVLICRVSGAALEVADDNQKELLKQSEGFSVPELIFIVRLFLKSYKDLSVSPRAEIPLLLAALEAAERKSGGKQASSSANQLISRPVKQPVVTVSNEQETASSAPAELSSADENQADGVMTLVEARIWWPAFLESIKKRNGPLANVLRVASLDDVAGSTIVLGVKFSFHKQNIDNQKNQALIREILKEITGKNLALRAIVSSDVNLEAPKVGPTLAEALQVFGGELIE